MTLIKFFPKLFEMFLVFFGVFFRNFARFSIKDKNQTETLQGSQWQIKIKITPKKTDAGEYDAIFQLKYDSWQIYFIYSNDPSQIQHVQWIMHAFPTLLWFSTDQIYSNLWHLLHWYQSNHYSDIIMSVMASEITSVSVVYSTICLGPDHRKHQSSASLAFVWGIHWWPVNSPHKWPVTRKISCHMIISVTSEVTLENMGQIFQGSSCVCAQPMKN